LAERITAFEYVEADTVFHRLDARTKFFMLFTIMFLVYPFVDPFFCLMINLALWAIAFYAKVWKACVLASKTVLIVGVFFLIYHAIVYVISPLMQGIISMNGVARTLSAFYKYANLVIDVAMFLAFTRSIELAIALAKLKIPAKVATILGVTLGFIPVFTSEITDVIDAYESRGLKTRYRNPVQKLFALYPLLTPVVFGSVRRAQMISVALECKGFGYGGERTYRKEIKLLKNDYVVIAVCIVLLVLVSLAYYVQLPAYPLAEPFFTSLFMISPLALVAAAALAVAYPIIVAFWKV